MMHSPPYPTHHKVILLTFHFIKSSFGRHISFIAAYWQSVWICAAYICGHWACDVPIIMYEYMYELWAWSWCINDNNNNNKHTRCTHSKMRLFRSRIVCARLCNCATQSLSFLHNNNSFWFVSWKALKHKIGVVLKIRNKNKNDLVRYSSYSRASYLMFVYTYFVWLLRS